MVSLLKRAIESRGERDHAVNGRGYVPRNAERRLKPPRRQVDRILRQIAPPQMPMEYAEFPDTLEKVYPEENPKH